MRGRTQFGEGFNNEQSNAYFGILSSFLLFAGCIFIIVAVLSTKKVVDPMEVVFLSALALVGLGVLLVSVRILRGKSLMSGYPMRNL